MNPKSPLTREQIRKGMPNFVSFICDVLDIDIPRIEHRRFKDIEQFKGTTQKAYLKYDGRRYVIVVDKYFEYPMDEIMAIAHELRHIWQIENDKVDQEKYLTSQETDIHTYNNQFEELDANAFAYAVIKTMFGYEIFTNLDDEMRKAIKDRAGTIILYLKRELQDWFQ